MTTQTDWTSTPPTQRSFEFTGRIRSFRYAGRGIAIMIASQHNAWIHALATVLVVAAGGRKGDIHN